jgi:hypothetical protein
MVKPWVELVLSLICIASLIVGSTKKRDAWWAQLLRFFSAAVHTDEPGTLKIPGTNVVLGVDVKPAGPGVPPRGNAGFARHGALVLAILMTVVAPVALALMSCAGSQTNVGVNSTVSAAPGGDVAWTVGVNVGITIAKQALPAVQSIIDARPEIAPDVKQHIDQGFHTAGDSLDLARTSFNTYAEAPTVANLCRTHFFVEQAITGALQSLVLVRDLGVQISPTEIAAAQAAVGSLGAIADMIYPACASSGPPAQHVSAMERIHHALGGGH